MLPTSTTSSRYSMSVAGYPALKGSVSESSGTTDVYFLTESPSAVLGNGPHHATTAITTLHADANARLLHADSPMASAPAAAFSPHLSWPSLLLHDELKQCMDDGVILADFHEAKIAFPPTYRRVLGRMLDVRELTSFAHVAQLYTTVLGDGKVRVPSYTDRILYHSLPAVRNRITCAQYTSAEYIETSDHKPVSCVFTVDKSSATLSPHSMPRGVVEGRKVLYSVQLTQLSVRWGPALEDFEASESECDMAAPSKGDASHDSFSSELSQATTMSGTVKPGMVFEGLRVRSVFPLPCEDPYAEERNLMEVADNLLFTSGKSTALKPTWKLNAWSTLARHGLRHSIALPPRRPLHMALNFIVPSGTTAGQGVISLTEAIHRAGRKVDFVATLTVGGRRTGEVTGKLCVKMDRADKGL
ncbi:hypothetical protein H310_11011 [Aphanomyces invadans]|uniref:Inositol polyphosphate-related phosphatase domain-containing protein n=1 Tax=Aphanomyces invadans TaxID=157072 RepID=A0A024TQE8_9STRA|nr:hypothetical protein H310_11011 [Aphanomyces invadans]ETV95572.1 hypothetical protein H310_11011 [Aphanomyces invadans]|eukprot:XP_008875765.1 hypothetical protein H310_11011 [Aphanomyces invadans]